MATTNIILIDALRETAKRLKNGAFYAWGHHGACNCGNLVQVVTDRSKEQVQKLAFTSTGEWSELANGFGEWSYENQNEYCEVSGTPLYVLFSQLNEMGLSSTDIHNLENLEDREVLRNLPGGMRYLIRNERADVILYFEAFAQLLENKLLDSININYQDLFVSIQNRIPEEV